MSRLRGGRQEKSNVFQVEGRVHCALGMKLPKRWWSRKEVGARFGRATTSQLSHSDHDARTASRRTYHSHTHKGNYYVAYGCPVSDVCMQGASSEILLYGATVISWKAGTASSPELVERLFVSSKAALDGSKPVRGGIPVVFPCFGPPSHAEHARLSQHGFARNQVWTYGGVIKDDESGVSVRLSERSC